MTVDAWELEAIVTLLTGEFQRQRAFAVLRIRPDIHRVSDFRYRGFSPISV